MRTERQYLIDFIESLLYTYLENKTDKETARQEAKELATQLSMSLQTTEGIMDFQKELEASESCEKCDTIDVGDEDHMDIVSACNH